jgi:hypothetical protein
LHNELAKRLCSAVYLIERDVGLLIRDFSIAHGWRYRPDKCSMFRDELSLADLERDIAHRTDLPGSDPKGDIEILDPDERLVGSGAHSMLDPIR